MSPTARKNYLSQIQVNESAYQADHDHIFDVCERLHKDMSTLVAIVNDETTRAALLAIQAEVSAVRLEEALSLRMRACKARASAERMGRLRERLAEIVGQVEPIGPEQA